jgi:hypothetical protein
VHSAVIFSHPVSLNALILKVGALDQLHRDLMEMQNCQPRLGPTEYKPAFQQEPK